MSPTWQPLLPSDAEAVRQLADRAHPALPECAEVFAERVRLFPDGCRKLVADGALVGYGIAYPWVFDQPPPLDTRFGALPTDADCFHLHDIVVSPALRGHGLGEQWIEEMVSIAREHRFSRLTLVSVYGTHRLWSRYGFELRETPLLSAKLATYGDTACYMVRPLEASAPRWPVRP